MLTAPSPFRRNSNLSISVGVPNAQISGGNARGSNAVDLQSNRAAATHVASGSNAVVLGGMSCTASGTNSVAGGEANAASGSSAVAVGGGGNTASGNYSTVLGGRQASTRGTYGRLAYGSGQFTTGGDAQAGDFVLRRATTDATGTNVTTDGTAPSTINLPTPGNTGTMLLKVLVVARQTGGSAGAAGDSAVWEQLVLLTRGASAATTLCLGSWGGIGNGGAGMQIVAATTQIAPILAAISGVSSSASGLRIAFSADTTNGGLFVSVVGELNKNIQWVARVLSVENVG